MKDLDYMVDTVKLLYQPDDIVTVEDLQYYIRETYDVEVPIEILEPLHIEKEDLRLQFKHIGM